MKLDLDSITVRLPSDMKTALEERAAAEDLTVSQLVRRHFTKVLKPAPRRKARKEAA